KRVGRKRATGTTGRSQRSGEKKISLKQRILRERRVERESGDVKRRQTLAAIPTTDGKWFTPGARVLHPTRGVGEIVELSPEEDGDDRTATLRFRKPPLREVCRLSEVPLRVIPDRR
ncbi:MAG: hypothetical protein Q4C47_09195, partial [Planctomycetia bacterium]|nr:hypothetical protein [Planctomycetia bacterium]